LPKRIPENTLTAIEEAVRLHPDGADLPEIAIALKPSGSRNRDCDAAATKPWRLPSTRRDVFYRCETQAGVIDSISARLRDLLQSHSPPGGC
jgi:hypothetical protein